MKYKILGYVLALLILLASIKISSTLVASKKEEAKETPPESIRAVRVIPYKESDINVNLEISGKLKAFNRIELFSEVSGAVLSNGGKFKEGNSYTAGEILLQIDDSDTKATLIASKSAFQSLLTQLLPDLKLDYSDNFQVWETYLLNFDAEKSIQALPKNKTLKEKQYLTIKNVYNQFYNIKSLEEKLSKYTIRAPFSGVLSSAPVQQGSIIRPGQKLGDFIQTEKFEMAAPINIKNIEFLKVGQKVNLYSEDINGKWNGVVKRISKHIDPQTQSITAYLELSGNGLKEGMYLNGNVEGGEVSKCCEIPRKLIQKDQSIYIVENDILKKAVPNILKTNESTLLISGLKEGDQIMNESFVGAYEGMKVSIVE